MNAPGLRLRDRFALLTQGLATAFLEGAAQPPVEEPAAGQEANHQDEGEKGDQPCYLVDS